MNTAQLQLAPFGRRIAAFIIDFALGVAVLTVAFSGSAPYDPSWSQEEMVEQMSAYSAELLPFLALFEVVYHAFFVWQYGASIGKFALGLRCVSAEGQRLNFTQSLARAILRFVFGSLISFLGLCVAFFTANRQGLHDMFARTVVVLNPPKGGQDEQI